MCTEEQVYHERNLNYHCYFNCLHSDMFSNVMVPLAGLEPAHPCGQQILSLPRLPIPPQGQAATL